MAQAPPPMNLESNRSVSFSRPTPGTVLRKLAALNCFRSGTVSDRARRPTSATAFIEDIGLRSRGIGAPGRRDGIGLRVKPRLHRLPGQPLYKFRGYRREGMRSIAGFWALLRGKLPRYVTH